MTREYPYVLHSLDIIDPVLHQTKASMPAVAARAVEEPT
jgi:hypothetical protein